MAKTGIITPLDHALGYFLKIRFRTNAFDRDVIARLIVSVVALPLAVVPSIAVDLPPPYLLILYHIKTSIIDMEDVLLIDMTGLVAIKTLTLDFKKKSGVIFLCASQ